jgi:hypothetical protein
MGGNLSVAGVWTAIIGALTKQTARWHVTKGLKAEPGQSRRGRGESGRLHAG